MSYRLADVAEAVVIKPGDTLVLRVHPSVNQKALHDCRERAKVLLPDLADVVVVACEQLAIYRPSELKADDE